MKKGLAIFCLLILAVLLAGCINKQKNEGGGSKKETGETDNGADSAKTAIEETVEGRKRKKFTIWAVYWDTDIFDELALQKENIDTICFFAAYFNQDKVPFIPENTTETYEQVKNIYGDKSFKSYLAFVNDLVKADHSSYLKDTGLLYDLLSSKEARRDHIDAILSMVKQGGFDGIEIDYEAIKEDDTLWGYFISFIKQLYAVASGENISVRIVLEPGAPLEKLTLPPGPEYVFMCYNLYGYGTEPGPKANRKFLLEMINKMKGASEKVSFAVATGGFDFYDGNQAEQITEEEALKLIEEYKAVPEREEESQSMVFTYTDKKGRSHEVWYADDATIKAWTGIIKESGDYGISLWRMGGNAATEIQD